VHPSGTVASMRQLPDEPHAAMSVLTISCDDCVMRRTSACDDCVVTFICDNVADDGVLLDLAEQRAVRLLAEAGLVPRLRHRHAV
jgi:hypothetical protein